MGVDIKEIKARLLRGRVEQIIQEAGRECCERLVRDFEGLEEGHANIKFVVDLEINLRGPAGVRERYQGEVWI